MNEPRPKLLEIERLSQVKQALLLVWQSSRRLTLASALLLVLQGIIPLGGLYLTKLIVDAVSAGITSPDKAAALRQMALYVVLAAIVMLLGALCSSLANLVRQAQSQIASDHVHDVLHTRSIQLDLEYYENSEYYDTLHRTMREAPFRPVRIVNGLVMIGQSAISLLAIAGLLFSFYWAIPLALVIATLPGTAARVRYGRKMHAWQIQTTALERRAGYFHQLLLDEVYAKELRLFNLGHLFKTRFTETRKRLREERFKINIRQSLAELLTLAGGTVVVFGSYAFIAYQTVNGLLTLGDLVMYFGAFQRGQTFLQDLLGASVGLYEDSLFLTSLNDFLSMKQKVIEIERPKPVPSPMQEGVAFNHVSFTYPNSSQRVLEDITLSIKPGEVVGLVGENGSGKTSLIKLLCRLYDPTSGVITVDGTPLGDLSILEWRRHLSVVFQDYRRYFTTMRENIWFRNLDIQPDDERIVQAARDSGIDSTISSFASGYDTMFGKWLENGEELSIGQAQKLALARTFVRDAQIMVLDEPTSAMDAKAEYEVFKRFREMTQGRTVILISHRLSNLRIADRIYLMQDGKIVETGTHEELVGNGGNYALLFETQAKAYR
jgi:ATP-binding cassette subfamily B protein